jgi:hypothetical protein
MLRGVLLSSFPLDEAGSTESTTLAGAAPPGWDVELYREETLLDAQRTGPEGRVRIDPAQAQRLHWKPAPEPVVQIDADGDVRQGIDINVESYPGK